MSLYDFDIQASAQQVLPPDKRTKNNLLFLKILIKPVQYLRELFLGSYVSGATAATWSNATTYAKYDQVIYNKQLFKSLKNSNTDNPLVQSSWVMIQNNFIGVSERVYYSGQKLVLEYALNKWFGTTFRQPPSVSDIYIVRNSIGINAFIVGGSDQNSSIVYSDSSSEFVVNTFTLVPPSNFTIYCPSAVYAALDVSSLNNEKIFRSFVDRYIPAGVTYSIQTY